MRYAHPNGDCLNIEKLEKGRKGWDALRAEIYPKSFENLSKICDAEASWEFRVFRVFRCSLTYLMRFAQNRRTNRRMSERRTMLA